MERNLTNLKGDVATVCTEMKVYAVWPAWASGDKEAKFELNARLSVSNHVLASRAFVVEKMLRSMGWLAVLTPGIVPTMTVVLGKPSS